MRMRKKKWVSPFLENEDKYLLEYIKSFECDCPIYLEIGMGMGDFITESAKENPDIFYIGFEKDETCVARSIKKARELGLENFRVILDDASNIEEIVDENRIDRIYLHFSDPWPKKHHHKRRLTYKTFLNKYMRILKNKGTLVYKTDNEDFFNDSLEYFKETPFIMEDLNRNYHEIERREPMTAYERKFVEAGKPIYFAKYRIEK